MANPKIVLTVIAASVALAACETVSVRTDAARDLSVASCHTYAFANEHVAVLDQQPAAFGNPLNAERLRSAIQTNMSIRGIQEVDRAAADCVVGYAMGTRQVLNGYYGGFYGAGWGYGRRGWGWGGGWGGGWGPGWGWDGPWVDNETRISVDIFDAKSHRAIWHATASQSVYELTGPAAVEKINLAASAIFSKFPIGAPVGAPVSAPASGAAAT
jgi:hypothetical protein